MQVGTNILKTSIVHNVFTLTLQYYVSIHLSNVYSYVYTQLFVTMVTSVLLTETTQERVVWRSVTIKPGVQYVMTSGTQLMLALFACNWDTIRKVLFSCHTNIC